MSAKTDVAILVIEDDETQQASLVVALKMKGFKNIICASTHTEALDLLNTQQFGLVLSDWDLVGTFTGFDLLRHVRASPEIKGTPFILMTGGDESRREVALAVGASAYFTKPYELSELFETITELLT